MMEIRITSGDYKGRYIGLPVGSGWDTNPVAQSNPPVNVPGTRYGVYAQEQAATKFSEENVGAVQSDLKALGYGRDGVLFGTRRRDATSKPFLSL
jgi:hypothetical protein